MGWQITINSSSSQLVDCEPMSASLNALLSNPIRSSQPLEDLPVKLGNQSARLADCADFVSLPDYQGLSFQGETSRLMALGHGLTNGRITVEGEVGPLVGEAMSGGEIRIQGDAGDFVGRGATGGRIRIAGNVGDDLAAPSTPHARGVDGLEVLVSGSAGDRIANRLRRGLIVIAGDAGEMAGYQMRAGTILIGGQYGIGLGLQMIRGTILLNRPSENPGEGRFQPACHYTPTIAGVLNQYLQQIQSPLTFTPPSQWTRWLGDQTNGCRGELLVAHSTSVNTFDS